MAKKQLFLAKYTTVTTILSPTVRVNRKKGPHRLFYRPTPFFQTAYAESAIGIVPTKKCPARIAIQSGAFTNTYFMKRNIRRLSFFNSETHFIYIEYLIVK